MEQLIVISDPQKVAELLAPLVAQQLSGTSLPAKNGIEKKKLVTVSQAEEIYGLKRTTIWELRRDGKLTNHGTGRSVRLSCEEIENLNK